MTIRQTLGAISLALLLFVTGCSVLGVLFPGIDLDPGVPIKCTALYERVGPDTDVGHDGCGNYWLRSTAAGDTVCTTWADSLGHVRIQCPPDGEDL